MSPDQLVRWTDRLRQSGHRPGVVLGSGMEGTVIDLGDHLVAKIWRRRQTRELETLRAFYDAVARAGVVFETPTILYVLEFDGSVATVETRLGGRPLRAAAESQSVLPDDDAVRCVVDVLAGLIAVEPTASMGTLPILEDEAPFDVEAASFERSLAGLVERRVEKYRGPLAARVPDLDAVVSAVVDGLRRLPSARPRLIHGDLIPANILVGDGRVPLAVLDFGFMTTIGDPAFDAAIAASVYDMYGPGAAESEAILDLAIAERFGYDPERLVLYRAAYALTTSNCFSASGSDGHFEWCLRVLRRPRVREALDL